MQLLTVTQLSWQPFKHSHSSATAIPGLKLYSRKQKKNEYLWKDGIQVKRKCSKHQEYQTQHDLDMSKKEP